MFDPLSAILIAIAVIAVAGCYLLYHRMREQNQLLQDIRNQYTSLLQDIHNGSQQQILNAAEVRSETRHRALASLFENADKQLDALVTRVMYHVMSESERTMAGFANSIDAGGGNNGSGGSGSSSSRNPLPPTSPSPQQQRTASAQSTRAPAAVQELFKSAMDGTPPSGAEDTEVYIKAIEAISQLYQKRTQQATEKHRHSVS